MIETHLRAHLPAAIAVVSGDDPDLRSMTGPLAVVHGGAGSPWNRRYGATAQSRQIVWRVMCVSNTMAGANIIAQHVQAAVDGLLIEGNAAIVRFVSDPIEDRDDPTEWRWSCTAEIVHHT